MAQLDSGIVMGGDSENLPLGESRNEHVPSKPRAMSVLRSIFRSRKDKGKQLAMTPESPSSSARTERLIQTRSRFSSDLEFEIECSKEHWSELSIPRKQKAEEDVYWLIEKKMLRREDQEYVQLFATCSTREDFAKADNLLYSDLCFRWRILNSCDNYYWEAGRKIAEGAQADIYTAVSCENGPLDLKSGHYVFKVFKQEMSVRDFVKQLERRVIVGYSTTYTCPIWSITRLQGQYLRPDLNGKFAVRMQRYWGDLRKLLDLRMQRGQWPLLSYSDTIRSMECIAKGMRDLHSVGVLHRDLKASNVFVDFTYKPGKLHCKCDKGGCGVDPYKDAFDCRVGDFECSVGVMGTRFWRAPEILVGVKNHNVTPELFTQKSDVYSYGMTCYEILTGDIPFDKVSCNNYTVVLGGGRPKLPEHVDSWMRRMVERCWHSDPSERPSFQELCDVFDGHVSKWKWRGL